MAQVLAKTAERLPQKTIRVWDAFVRLFHWSVVVGFFVAYFTEDGPLTLHVWAGYVVGLLVVLRIVWGFIGPEHARFSSFIYPPGTVLRYLWDLIVGRAQRYLGHSPGGGAMVLVLLIGLLGTVGTGLALYAIEESAGPLAPFVSSGSPSGQTQPALEQGDERYEGAERSEELWEELWEELHEVLANLMLVLVILHVAGVLFASHVHRENLTRAMITGRKRAPSE
jgi:cytochrome b